MSYTKFPNPNPPDSRVWPDDVGSYVFSNANYSVVRTTSQVSSTLKAVTSTTLNQDGNGWPYHDWYSSGPEYDVNQWQPPGTVIVPTISGTTLPTSSVNGTAVGSTSHPFMSYLAMTEIVDSTGRYQTGTQMVVTGPYPAWNLQTNPLTIPWFTVSINTTAKTAVITCNGGGTFLNFPTNPTNSCDLTVSVPQVTSTGSGNASSGYDSTNNDIQWGSNLSAHTIRFIIWPINGTSPAYPNTWASPSISLSTVM